MTSFLPSTLKAHFDNACHTCTEYVTKAYGIYRKLEDAVVEQVDPLLPDNLKPLVRKVCRALPDALFSLSMITGNFRTAAVLYGSARLIWTVMPIIDSLIKGNFAYEGMTTAGKESVNRLMYLYEQFKPAIALSCTVSSVFCTLFGTLSCDLSLLMQGLFMGLIGYMAYCSMVDSRMVDPRMVDPGSTAPGGTSSVSGT